MTTAALRPKFRKLTARNHRLHFMVAAHAMVDHLMGHRPVPGGYRCREERDLSCFGVFGVAVVPLCWGSDSDATAIDDRRVLSSFAGQVAVRFGLGETVARQRTAFADAQGGRFTGYDWVTRREPTAQTFALMEAHLTQ